jgi:heat shock protein HslJ
MPDLTGVIWMWLQSEYSDHTSVIAADPSRYTLEFHTDGTIAIGADCNRVVGTYSQQESQLTIRLGATTLAGCPADSQASTFLADLGRVASYVMDGDKLVLNLQLDSGNVVLQPQAVSTPPAARPLPTAVPWRIQSYNNGRDGVVSVLPGTEAGATFADDGTVTGSTGCNTFRAPYRSSGSNVTFGPLATTRRACASAEATAQEQAIIAAFGATSSFELFGDRMTLRSADGATQLILLRPLDGPTPG